MPKILIIEDDPHYQKLMGEVLSEYKIIKAYDGQEGLEVAEKENPDLILLDLMLPKMGGMEMLNALRKNSKGKKMKVIVLTNLDPGPDLIEKTLQNQPTYYLVKSDTKLSELKEKIKEVLAFK